MAETESNTRSLTERFVPPTGFAAAWLKAFDPHAAREHPPVVTAPAFDLGDRAELGDRASNAAGLRARFGRSGEVSFLVYVNTPKREKVTLALWSERKMSGRLTLEQAREWADRVGKAAKRGELEAAKRELRAQLTAHIKMPEAGPWRGELVRNVERVWFKRCIEPVWRNGKLLSGRREPAAVERSMRLMLEEIGDMPITSVRELDLNPIVQAALNRGTRGAARLLLAHIKQFFRWAKVEGYFTPPPETAIRAFENPAAALSAEHFKIRIPKRKRIADDGEIKAVWFIHEHTYHGKGRPFSQQIRLGLRFLLLTGLRSQELRLNRWENVVWDGEIKDGAAGPALIVPVALQKGDEAHREEARDWVVPIPPQALALLRELKALAGNSLWIIPSPLNAKQPLAHSSWSKALSSANLCDKAGNNLRPHDLRRTFRTGISRLASAAIAERCLNHVLPDMQAVYDQHDYLDERREALEKWAEHVMRIVHGDDGGGVVPLVTRKRA